MASARRNGDRPTRRRIRKLRLLGLLSLLAMLGLVSFTFGFVSAIASEIPALEPDRQQRQEVDGYIYGKLGAGQRVLAVLRGSESRVLVDSSEISPWMKHAIVAIEDKRFFEHRGIDLRGIARAIWADIRNKRVVQGGSTITQQFVKNAYIENQRTFGRKLKEAALAWQLEQQWSKHRIRTAYLNTIYFGNGAYGVQQAAKTYFHKGASKLQLHEAALLAGIPADPSRYDPVTNPDEARERRDIVLRALLAQGKIRGDEYRWATTRPLPRADDVRLPGTEGPAQYFVNYVKQQLIDEYGSGRVFGGGYRVKTTIDLNLQQLARAAISKSLTNPNGPSAALVALDPRNGEVLAMVGGNNYRKSQFNLAVQSRRQPGSAFKPFVLAAALDAGVSPGTRFDSEPTSIFLGDRYWQVSNYEDSYLGRIDLATATTFSDNAVYAQLTELVGPEKVAKVARQLGITSPVRGYFAIGLGAESVNPLELARAYAAFANGGHRIDGNAFGNRPRVIKEVRDEHGRVVAANLPVPKKVLGEEENAIVTSLLQDVVERGTGKAARLADRPAAGKTGTTENYGDAWFVGYTPRLVTAVWVGYPNELRPMLTEFDGDPVAGGTYPALIWKTFMESAHELLQAEPESFPPAPSWYGSSAVVVRRDGQLRVDNGKCRSRKYAVVYLPGRGPAGYADCKENEVEVPRVVGETLAEARARLAAQPLRPTLVYKPARPLQRLGVVLEQYPPRGTLSSYDNVTLVLPKPRHGVVPNVVGMSLEQASEKLRGRELEPEIASGEPGDGARVVKQTPPGGVAAVPGLDVKLVVAAGSRTASRQGSSATAGRRRG